MVKKISRRDFLKALAAVTGAGVVGGSHWMRKVLLGSAKGQENKQFLPVLEKAEIGIPSPTPTRGPTSTPEQPAPTATKPVPPGSDPRVVHLHSLDATFWDRSDHRYWNYVDQDVVDEMVDVGLMALTGKGSVAEAWNALLPDYQPGQGIAIKVNFNNSWNCDHESPVINAIIHPVNSIVRGLKQIGVIEEDLWIYDAVRWIPDYFVEGSLYGMIRFFDRGCREIAGFLGDQYVYFDPPEGITINPIKITDLLADATYLINIPQLKGHDITAATLGFKNHLGSIQHPGALHNYIDVQGSDYRSDYNPMVDIYKNPHFGGKTILTLGDGLFGAYRHHVAPTPWTTFGDKVPNSLYLATDPVALDCVMCDFLDAELSLPDLTYDYLCVAEDAGLGTFERGDPWGQGYKLIDYQYYSL